MDFAALPPEINSSLMYAGQGSGPMLAAASAWNGLAAELNATASSYEGLISDLISESWLGPASTVMATAVAPYVTWMHTSAARVAQTASQAHAAAAAYETAFAATVPPTVVAENRALLLQLIATNLFGQNSAAIAATQAQYAQMWAQDAAAMYAYSASSAAATELAPFTEPEQVSNPAGQAQQATNAAGNAVGTGTQDALAAVPQTLQQLAAPLQAVPAPAVVDDFGVDVATATGLSGVSFSSAYHTAIGSANFFQRLASQFGLLQPQSSDIKATVDKIALATGAVVSEEELQPAAHSPLHGFTSWQNWLKWIQSMGAHAFHMSATAGMGESPMVGGLSVPRAWSAAAPEIRLAVTEVPTAGVEAAPTAGGGTGSLGAQAALAGMAGRALAGSVGATRDGRRSTSHEQPKPSADAAREIAAALREYASLRDSGIITEVEFNRHKERLMSLDPLSGR